MKNYLISYDLNQSGQNYDALIKAIKSYIHAVSVLKSVWFSESSALLSQPISPLQSFHLLLSGL